MASVGIVGGLGPESTIDYYRRILAAWQRDDPGSTPSIVIDSLDVARALSLVEHDRAALIEYLVASLHRLAGAGVDLAALTANTPHIVFDELATRSRVPLVSIVEVCAAEAQRRGLHRLALLGTRFTMEADFYPTVFARYGITVVRPDPAERAWVHDRYVGELLRGEFKDETRRHMISIVERLGRDEQVDGVILGGTELPLLLADSEIAGLPALDTTALHVAEIVQRLRSLDSRVAVNAMQRAAAGEPDAEFIALEAELRAAQLAADVATLDRLIADELLFTGPDGQLGTKAQDLEAHRSGAVRFRAHDPEELRVRRIGTDVAICALRARLAVEVSGTLVHGTYRYTRVWARESGGPWRVVGGHVSAAARDDGVDRSQN